MSSKDGDRLQTMRHSASHVLACAVTELFPGARLGIGPATEEGFYYDFDLPRALTSDDLANIEARMVQLIQARLPFVRFTKPVEEALAFMREQGQDYKVELIQDLQQGVTYGEGKEPAAQPGPVEEVTFYRTGNLFVDLCKGPHVEHTGQIGVVKLLSIAGAYWRGDEKRPMLQRIYGVAFDTQEELDGYLRLQEEARERDHRSINKTMQLYAFSPWVGKGLPLLLPKGAAIRRELERFIVDEEIRRGYQHVYTPPLALVSTYETSGHWAHYQEFMYPAFEMDTGSYVLRPANCPHHFAVYAAQPRIYKDLPLRIAEIGDQYRVEKSGELSGLTRVRIMNLNDSHIFVTPDQLESAFLEVLELIKHAYRLLGLHDFWYRLSLHDPADKIKYLHDEEKWNWAESTLRHILISQGEEFEEGIGEAAHYGPKLDVQVPTATGHSETLSTIQLDPFMPGQFRLEYLDADQIKKIPVVLHRGIISSMERMLAFVTEHFKGKFPVWLAPVQVVIIPIADAQRDYAANVAERLRDCRVRVEVDDRSERMNAKIRDAQLQNVPYMLVVGKREAANNSVSVRLRTEENLGEVPVEGFVNMVTTLIRDRSLDLIAENALR